MVPAAARAGHGFSSVLGDNDLRLGDIIILPHTNGFCRRTLKRGTTPFAEGCTASPDGIRTLTPLKGLAFMPFLTTRAFTSPFTLILGSFESICGRLLFRLFMLRCRSSSATRLSSRLTVSSRVWMIVTIASGSFCISARISSRSNTILSIFIPYSIEIWRLYELFSRKEVLKADIQTV